MAGYGYKGKKTAPGPSKFRPAKKTIKKAVNYERSLGQTSVAPPPGVQRKHSDTLASLPLSEKMKQFESGAAEQRRSMWLKRAEEKKGPAKKPKAPKGKAPTPPAKPHAKKPAARPADEAYRQSVRASPIGVANLRSNYQPGVRSPKTAPRKAAPRPPAKPAPKADSGPPRKAVPE